MPLENVVLKTNTKHTLGRKFALCTGCGACAAICPECCISMDNDSEGFLQPCIDVDVCSDCGLCRKLCPVNKKTGISDVSCYGKNTTDEFPTVWASWNLDEDIRCNSSSGGVFTVLAENVFSKGGVVVGAAFDKDLVVRHCIITSSVELGKLRGSKYIQSVIATILYHDIQNLLEQGRLVLFSGTPCQVAGLRHMLRRQYDNLFCCDVMCHGVPSPKFFEKYQNENFKKEGQLKEIVFRDKSNGWKHYNVRCHFKNGVSRLFPLRVDTYMLAFLRNIALRLSCYSCKFTKIRRQGDLTLGDFWGVARVYPEYDIDDKGTSLILVNTVKGQGFLHDCEDDLFLGQADINTAIAGNPQLVRSVQRPSERVAFYRDLDELSFKMLVQKYQLCRPPFQRRVISGLKRRIKKILGVV